MSWTVGKPQETWAEKDLHRFFREIYGRFKFGSFTWNPPNVPANSTVDTALTTATSEVLTGLRAGQAVAVTPPSTIDAGLTWGAWCATDDTLTIRLVNTTGGAINPASGDWSFQGALS